jgi:hypothetical protein
VTTLIRMRGFTDPLKALGMCLITAEAFSSKHGWGLIQVQGLEYRGREHWASISFSEDFLDATVVDMTMRQFDDARPAYWEGTLDDWLDDMAECLVDNLAYAVYSDTDTDVDPYYTDFWIREDIEPGDMKEPWRT